MPVLYWLPLVMFYHLFIRLFTVSINATDFPCTYAIVLYCILYDFAPAADKDYSFIYLLDDYGII